jgi:hypothetical protein
VTPSARDTLADPAGEGRAALAVEVAFEAVADRLVQQHAGPAGTEHDGHRACRGIHGLEIDQRLTHGFVGEAVRTAVGDQLADSHNGRHRPNDPAHAGRSARRSPGY